MCDPDFELPPKPKESPFNLYGVKPGDFIMVRNDVHRGESVYFIARVTKLVERKPYMLPFVHAYTGPFDGSNFIINTNIMSVYEHMGKSLAIRRIKEEINGLTKKVDRLKADLTKIEEE